MRFLTVLEALGKKKPGFVYKESIEKIENQLQEGEMIVFAIADNIKRISSLANTKGELGIGVLCVTESRILVVTDKFNADISLDSLKGATFEKTGTFKSEELHIVGAEKTFKLSMEDKKKAKKAQEIQEFLTGKGVSATASDASADNPSVTTPTSAPEGPFRTLSEVEAYLKANNDTVGKRDLTNFDYLLEHLYEDEVIHIAFTGVLEAETTDKRGTVTGNRESNSSADSSNAAFAITNERLIYARNASGMGTLLGMGSYVKSIDLEEIRKVSSYTRLLMGSIILESITNTIRVQHNKDFVAKMAEKVRRFIDTHKKEQKQAQSVPVQTAPQIDITEELRKYKQLEVDGIITAEEFETKKKELMGYSG